MTGRGIDQVLPHPNAPVLHEEYVTDARGYVRLAEQAHGAIPCPVAPGYLWGDALEELERRAPDLRIVNLETAVTSSDDAAAGKGINYRMHPANIGCLTAARVDCAVLANNHVLDWGPQGLIETLATLRAAGIRTAGGGADSQEAAAPAVLAVHGARVLVFAYASASSGVPDDWCAGRGRPGVQVLPDLGAATVRDIAMRIHNVRLPGDFVIVSLHWGANWGYPISRAERDFAHALIDEAGADLVHGHSSHHAKAIEVHRDRLILYGCGDFINDYEGIGGHERYRGDLALAYFARYEDRRLRGLDIVPFTAWRFRLQRATPTDTDWVCATLNREGQPFGTELIAVNGGLALRRHTGATGRAARPIQPTGRNPR